MAKKSSYQRVDFETAVAIFRCGGKVWWDYGSASDYKSQVVESLQEAQVERHEAILRVRTYYVLKAPDHD